MLGYNHMLGYASASLSPPPPLLGCLCGAGATLGLEHSGRALYPNSAFLEFLHDVTGSCDPSHCLQVAASLQEAAGILQAPRLAQTGTGWVIKSQI